MISALRHDDVLRHHRVADDFDISAVGVDDEAVR
jgi:hypothetical protein